MTTTISNETAATKTVWSKPSTAVVVVPAAAPTAKQKQRQSILDVTIPEQARTKSWSISSSSSSSSSQMTRMDSEWIQRLEPPIMWSSSSSLKSLSSSSSTDTLTSLSSTTTTNTEPSLSSSHHEDHHHHPLPSMMMIQPHYHLHHRCCCCCCCSTFDQQGVVVLGASGTWAKRRRRKSADSSEITSPETMKQNCGCYHQQQHGHYHSYPSNNNNNNPTILNSIDSCEFCCHCGCSSSSSSSWSSSWSSWSSSSSSLLLSSGALHHPSSSCSNFHHHHHCHHHHCGQYHNQGLINILLKSISKARIPSTTITMTNPMLLLMMLCLLLFLLLLLTRAILLVPNTVTLSSLLLLLILSYLKNRHQHLQQHPNHHKFSNNHHHHHHHHAATRMLKKIIILMAIINCLMIVAQANNNDSQNENKDGAGSEHEPDNKSDAYSDAGSNITRILNAFFDSGYDKRVRPEYGGPPVQVGVTMHVIGISSVSEVQMDFTSDFYFRQLWKDNRLAFTPVGGIDNLVVGAEVAQKIWVPDTFFANEKVASFHSATTPNTFLRILSTGEVYRSIRLTVTASCPMNLQYFPMDSQLCSIEIESYGYSMADIIYIWAKGKESIGMSKGLELPQFKVVGYRQSMKIETLSTGNYSRLVCEIQFERSMGYYLIQIYIPASLIVIISWVSFWLHRNATPARVALGVTTVLTMTTLMSSTNAALPKISYIKSIDVFLGTCFVMVFASLLEYASVGYLGKRIAMRKTRSQQLAKLAQEHRNRCAAAAAAAAAAATGATPRSCSINMNLSGANSMANNGQPQSMDDDDGCGGGVGQSNNEPSDVPPSSIPPPMPGGPPGTMMCQQTDLSATLHRPLKPIPIHQTMERMDRYATIGTPRIVHHPSMNCPPTCPQAYARQDVRLNRATPILSGPECAQAHRKSFSGKSTYSMGSGHHLPDSPINGSGPCSMIPPPPGPMVPPTGMLGPHCSQQPLPMQHHPQQSQPSTSSPTINLHKRHHQQHHHPQHLSDSGLGPDGDNLSMGGGPTPPVQPHPHPHPLPPPHPPTGGGGGLHFGSKNPNKLFGVSPSDIDKYSRVVFPVCFVCFNLMYWVIYLHISSQMIEDLIPAQ